MPVCYLVQSHRSARQIVRLVETLGRGSPGAIVVVAHDTAGCALAAGDLRGNPRAHYLPVAGPLRRGYLSMLDPYFQAVEWLRREGVDYEWLVYLSGQDYPTQPLERSEATLAASAYDGYLRFWPALAADNGWGRVHQGWRRYYYRYHEAPRWALPGLRLLRRLNDLQPLLHVHLVYGPRLGWRTWRTPFTAERPCYGGWQWTTLRRSCAEFLCERVRGDGALMKHYRHSVCPDESLAQTVLVNAGRFRLANDNLRYADSHGSRDGRPRLLGVADLARVTSGAYHFARKFDLDHDARVLDLLDEHLAAAS